MHPDLPLRASGPAPGVDTDALAAVLALLPSPVVALDGAGRVAAASPLGAQACGCADAAALVGTDFAALVGEEAAAWALGGDGGARTLDLLGLDGARRRADLRMAPGGAGGCLLDVRLHEREAVGPADASPTVAHTTDPTPEIPPLLRDSPIGVVVTRRGDGRICDANDAFLDLVGRTRAAVVGHTALDIGLWASTEERSEHIAAMSEPVGVRCELGRIRHGSGELRDVRAWKHPIGASGAGGGFLLSLVIGDERRTEAEDALASERDFSRAILDAAGQSVVIADGGDRLAYANAAFGDLVGVPVADLIGRPFRTWITPDARGAYDAEVARRRAGERGIYETCVAHASGETRSVLVTAIPHPSGEPGASIALVTDMTAIRAAQHEADAQRAFYEGLVGRLPVRIVLTDADWRFRFANAEAIPDDALRAWSIGRTFEEVAVHAGMPETRRAAFAAARRQVDETGHATEWVEEVLERGPDGSRTGEVRHLLQRIEPLAGGPDAVGGGYLGYAVDVTERVRAERVADEARAFYETILGELPIPVTVFEADGRLRYANAAAVPRLALRTRLVGHVLPDRMARQMGVRGDGRDRLRETVATGKRMEWEETRARAGYPPRHLLASLVPIVGPGGGAVEHVLAYSVDVTAQREGRLAVERTQAHYERILRRLPIELYIVRPDGTFDFLNAAAVRDAGTRAWLVGRRNLDYARVRGFDEAPFAARDAWVQSILDDPREATREETLDLPGRPTRHMLRALLPVFGSSDDGSDAEGGDLAFLIGYGIDLTDRVAAAAQQEAQRAFYESVLANLPLGVAVFDRDGRTLYVSPEVIPEAHLRAAALGKTNEDMARLRGRPAEKARARDAWIRSAIEGGLVSTHEERLVFPGGAARDLLRTAIPVFHPDGSVDYLVGYTLDVTERKRYETSLVEAKEQAEELGRLKSAFLANMSHEVRTPLAGIIGFAEVLMDELGEPHVEAAQLIRQSGMRLLDTLNSVLDLARLEANAVDLDLVRLDVGAETAAAGRLLSAMAAPRGLPLTVETPPAPVFTFLDARAYHRVLVNLVSNAIKFTNAGEVRLSVTVEGDEAVVRVRDTGIGMDAAFLPHVFDEFRQESSGLTRSHQGSGLGLAITRHLVGLMHGRLAVESEKGVGSTFIVRFPLAS